MDINIRIPWPGWRPVRVLGHGGYGTVYEIERVIAGTTEKAALKIVSIPNDDNEIEKDYEFGLSNQEVTFKYKNLLEQYQREYLFMMRLKGESHIVSCEDFYVERQVNGVGYNVYIRMELLTPLTKILKDRNLSEGEIIRIGEDICRALIICEQEKIIHRDIKPANILRSKFGNFKLGDFGVSRVMEHTSTATSVGTQGFAAQEVFHNKSYGKTADIYSLGIVLYWLLNNRRMPLVNQEDKVYPEKIQMAILRRYSGEKFAPPENGSDELKRIVMKACAYEPGDRYQNAREMLEALERLKIASGFGSNQRTRPLNPVNSPEPVRDVYLTQPVPPLRQNTTAKERETGIPKKKNLMVPVLIGVIGAIAVLVGVILFLKSSGKKDDSIEPTPVVAGETATPTPEPKETPEPTATPTPEPTATPTPEPIAMSLRDDATDEERWIYAYKLITNNTMINGADFITHSAEERQVLKNALLDMKTPADYTEEKEYSFHMWSNGRGNLSVYDYSPNEPGLMVCSQIQNYDAITDTRYYPKDFPVYAGDSLDTVFETLRITDEMVQDLSYQEITGDDMLEGVSASRGADGTLVGISFIRKDNVFIGLNFYYESSPILSSIYFCDNNDYTEKKEELLQDLHAQESYEYPWNSGKKIVTGDSITFGVYEQDNDLNNGPEDITWYVAYADENEALLVCNRGLDFVDYMKDEGQGVTWSGSTIRNWLRTEFYTQAFSPEEQAVILTKTLETKEKFADGIETSEDTVFILSSQEADEYLDSLQKQLLLSDYAKRNFYNITTCGSYYRSYNTTSTTVEGADAYGENRPYFCNDPISYNPPVAVRPAVWINLKY